MVSLATKAASLSPVSKTNSLSNSEVSIGSLTFGSQDIRGSEIHRRGLLPSRQTLVEYNGYRFLITDSPSDVELPSYRETLKNYNVKHVVRVCEPSYDAGELIASDFKVHDWYFEDGGMPNATIVNSWLKLVDFTFDSKREGYNAKETIAVHCKAGLGRAPVLVALALIELGMEPINAIGLIRIKRRGAINGQQLQELVRYQKRDSDAKGQSKSKGRFAGRPMRRPMLFGRRRSSVKDNLDELAAL
mmetsp:Transcript_7337/g.10962  ORF Transcript_7337/g.10962 Transcript_7337/m.10962 type:complete len:246 (-) Transcript_7337:265-1002(-)